MLFSKNALFRKQRKIQKNLTSYFYIMSWLYVGAVFIFYLCSF